MILRLDKLFAWFVSKTYGLYEWYLWKQIEEGPKPRHIGLILDGNRRFAEVHGLKAYLGHEKGAEKLENVLKWCWDIGIEIATIYAFSTENFQRSPEEVREIMRIIVESFEELLEDERVHKNKVKVRAIGRLNLLPDYVQKAIQKAEEETKDYNNYVLNVAIGYGGRTEILDAFRAIATKIQEGKLDTKDITEKIIEDHLYTAGLPDPDLIIRTSGEERLSGFLLWQSAYSELYFVEAYFPAFRKIDFWRAIRTFQQRDRRFGK
ncbi:MAG: polyprenyl diphosphate synthase [Candidatus Heimdallarchaeota archaeon]